MSKIKMSEEYEGEKYREGKKCFGDYEDKGEIEIMEGKK